MLALESVALAAVPVVFAVLLLLLLPPLAAVPEVPVLPLPEVPALPLPDTSALALVPLAAVPAVLLVPPLLIDCKAAISAAKSFFN